MDFPVSVFTSMLMFESAELREEEGIVMTLN
jgi:hypothetical protein